MKMQEAFRLKGDSTQVVSSKLFEIFKNTFLYRTPPMAACFITTSPSHLNNDCHSCTGFLKNKG